MNCLFNRLQDVVPKTLRQLILVRHFSNWRSWQRRSAFHLTRERKYDINAISRQYIRFLNWFFFRLRPDCFNLSILFGKTDKFSCVTRGYLAFHIFRTFRENCNVIFSVKFVLRSHRSQIKKKTIVKNNTVLALVVEKKELISFHAIAIYNGWMTMHIQICH